MGRTNMTEMHIRPMELKDVPKVVEVDQASFPTPWKQETYEHEISTNNYAQYFIVETEDGHLIGYVGLWLVLEEAQITNIAIHPKYRGYKIGEKLFGFAMQYAMNQGAKRLSLEVRVSNIIAQKMYRKFGLVPGGIRKGYYPDNGEDAIVMWVELQ